MTGAEPNAYLRTKVLTASPAELRLMLLDGALRFADQARSALEAENYEGVYEGVSRCQAILMELINSLRPEQDPELCTKLSGLYTFMYTRLIDACTKREIEAIREVIQLLEFERETWLLLMDKLRDENAAASTLQAIPHDLPGTAASPADDEKDRLISGRISLQG
jgi:flagellar protein FliS